MHLSSKHLAQPFDHLLKGRQISVPLAWCLILLLIVAFLLPYFLFTHLYDEAVVYGSLALVPLCLAAYLLGLHGVLITWGVIGLGIACALWIHEGTTWSSVQINNFFFGNLFGLFAGSCAAQFFYKQRQARELQERLNHLKDQIILQLSHELRTPLTTIQGYLELLSIYQQSLDEEQRAKFLEFASQGCIELVDLITNILDVSSFEAQQALQLEPVALAHVVTNIVEQWNPRERQDYQVEVEVPEDITVQATPQYLLQILRNLLSNALKYSPPHSRIVISAAIDDARHWERGPLPAVCISVKDEGLGIPPKEIPLLFNKFIRLKRDLNGSVLGTGLGLYICKQLVEAMQGRIWVESSGKAGEGSRFCFLLMSAPSTHDLSARGLQSEQAQQPPKSEISRSQVDRWD